MDFNLSCCPSAHQDPEALAQADEVHCPWQTMQVLSAGESRTGDEAEAAGPDELESEPDLNTHTYTTRTREHPLPFLLLFSCPPLTSPD